jgi:hypothetical protein
MSDGIYKEEVYVHNIGCTLHSVQPSRSLGCSSYPDIKIVEFFIDIRTASLSTGLGVHIAQKSVISTHVFCYLRPSSKVTRKSIQGLVCIFFLYIEICQSVFIPNLAYSVNSKNIFFFSGFGFVGNFGSGFGWGILSERRISVFDAQLYRHFPRRSLSPLQKIKIKFFLNLEIQYLINFGSKRQ